MISCLSAPTTGINIVERVPLNVGENRYNTKYLDTKAKKMGHYIVHNNE